jgi:hypothetical protein
MFDIGLSDDSIAVMAQQLLSISLATKEGHYTHLEITDMYLEIFKKLKEQLVTTDSVVE